MTRIENEAKEQLDAMANSQIDSGSNLMLQSGERGGILKPMIQIEDMGGVTNVTQNLSQINERKA